MREGRRENRRISRNLARRLSDLAGRSTESRALGFRSGERLYQYLTENSLQIPGANFARLQKIAEQNALYLIVGVHERKGGTLYNTTIYLQPDGGYKIHRKLTPTYTERLVWGVGDGSTLNVLETPFGVLGGLICWEHWMPLARAAMHAKGETIHAAQFPTVHERHQIASRHYAFEGQCFVLTSGLCLVEKRCFGRL